MNFKAILKFSLIYILVTSFLEKLYYLLFNVQKIQEIGFAQVLFNPLVFNLIFIIILILLVNEIAKNKEFTFKKILITCNRCFQTSWRTSSTVCQQTCLCTTQNGQQLQKVIAHIYIESNGF